MQLLKYVEVMVIVISELLERHT